MASKRSTNLPRTSAGATLIEMAVGLVITGIAIAGLGELLWINGSFSNRIFNKIDNVGSAKLFYQTIGKDIRSAKCVGNGQSGGSDTYTGVDEKVFQLNCSTLIVQMPYFPYPSNDAVATETYLQGYPIQSPTANRPVLDTVIFKVEPGSVSGYCINRYYYPDPTYVTSNRVKSSATVLNNLTGPIDTQGRVHAFDYMQRNGAVYSSTALYPFSTDWTLLDKMNEVVVNVELQSSSQNSAHKDTASVGLKKEFFMRNFGSADKSRT